MPEPALTPSATLDSAWAVDMDVVTCEHCDWRYLRPRSLPITANRPSLCPHCWQERLVVTGDLQEAPYPYPPELVVPFNVSDAALQDAVQRFAKGVPYAPDDLNYPTLRSRLAQVYLPVWLVDGSIEAEWQAESGFDYQVVSHQEHYSDSGRGWQTRQVREPRIRWEPRLGRIQRQAQNISAPALEEAAVLQQTLGKFDLTLAQPYQPGFIERASVRLPDRSTHDAWPEAAAGFQHWAEEQVQQACGADHLRRFRWQARFDQLHWTLLLLPAYTTYYLDDDLVPQPVLIHGQTGQTAGKRRASMHRAQRTSLIFVIVGLVLSILGLVFGGLSMVMPVLMPLAVGGLLLGIPTLLAALIPIGIAWDFNRQTREYRSG